MLRQAERLTVQKVLLGIALLATFLVTPWLTYDPINVPKLAIISVGAFVIAGIIGTNISKEELNLFRFPIIALIFFILDLTAVLIFSGNNFWQEFFGTFGRATGYVAYMSLGIVLLGSILVSSLDFIKKITYLILITGGASNVYGVLQSFKIDPIDWVNPYSPVVGFLGNPNFQSSFIGFSGIIAFSYLISPRIRTSNRWGFVAFLIVSIYVIGATHSQQGFLVLAGGMGFTCLTRMKNSKYIKSINALIILAIIGVGFVIYGTLNKGPLATLLYKESVTYRGDYWRAGWKMTLEHPFFGVGLDSYGDWYRRSRTVEATLRRGPDIVSNAAHNVLIDFSSNGGIPLLVIYVALMGLTLLSVVKILKRSNSFEPGLVGIIAVWFAYQAQSVISLNQLGLAIWGWLISGALIGFEVSTRNNIAERIESSSKQKSKSRTVLNKSSILPKSVIGLFVGLIVGSLVGLPPLLASSKYLAALKSQNVAVVEQAVDVWPQEPARTEQIAIAFLNSKLESQALNVARKGVDKFPDDFELWKLVEQIPSSTEKEKIQARLEMKRLDPHNPELK